MIEICPRCNTKSLINHPRAREVIEGKEKQVSVTQWKCVYCGFEENKIKKSVLLGLKYK